MTVDSLTLIGITATLLGMGIVFRSLEVVFTVRELGNDGLIPWTRTPHVRHRFDAWQRRLGAPPVAAGVLVARVPLAAAAVWLPFDHQSMPWILMALLATQAYYLRRFKTVTHAADTMFLIGLAGAFAAALDPGDRLLTAAALLFLAAQAMVAYAAAGVAKLRSPEWRHGRFLGHALVFGAYGTERLGTLLIRQASIAWLLGWAVILLELLLAICPLLPAPAFHVVLALGVAFHFSIAAMMGLHTFFWSFLATYPGLYFMHYALWRLMNW